MPQTRRRRLYNPLMLLFCTPRSSPFTSKDSTVQIVFVIYFDFQSDRNWLSLQRGVIETGSWCYTIQQCWRCCCGFNRGVNVSHNELMGTDIAFSSGFNLDLFTIDFSREAISECKIELSNIFLCNKSINGLLKVFSIANRGFVSLKGESDQFTFCNKYIFLQKLKSDV